MKQLFTEEQVVKVSDKILNKTIEKIKNELSDKFYNEMRDYLYEHYDNASEEIHESLIHEITDQFIEDPKNYKFLKLRERLFNENKELLTSILTEEAITKSVENIIWQHTSQNYQFHWKWSDAIVRIIKENWNTLRDDERINNGLLRDIDRLESLVEHLRAKINENED